MVRLGLDMYSLRSQNWTPFQQLDFCAQWGLQVVHYSEVRLIGGLEPAHLRRLRSYADERGVQLELGMLSICPSSVIFDATQGSADQQIERMLTPARLVGSPFVRCVVGAIEDRRQPGGIERRIADTLEVLRLVRSRVMDAGLKLAIENHAGDMQARELKALVEAAGSDFVGVCVDAGNALWSMEDPHLVLETLAPYVLTSHTRDTAVWDAPKGTAVYWTRMGEGNVRIGDYLRAFIEKCPDRPLSLEIIVVPEPRVMRHREREFWDGYRAMPAWEFARFLALASDAPAVEVESFEPSAERELADVEASLRWTKAFLKGGVSGS
jgi:sugar phosphate isomerase/epimerase